MALLFYSDDDDPAAWRREVLRHAPALDWRTWPELGEVEAIDAALVWLPPPGLLAGLPNLKAVFSLAAGVDAMLRDPTLPDLPLCRMVDASLTRSMSEWVLLQVLKYHRLLDVYGAQQRSTIWRLYLPPGPAARVIGVMGLGELGTDAALTLARHGFTVHGWSRTRKEIGEVRCHAGSDGLASFLAELDVLVCLLPLTPQTDGILNAGLFSRLKPGCRLINVARGRHLVEQDLLDALATGRIAHASLDVAREEPPPQGHPFWRHPLIDLSPHTASYTTPESGGALVAENLLRLEAGAPLLHVVDRTRGY